MCHRMQASWNNACQARHSECALSPASAAIMLLCAWVWYGVWCIPARAASCTIELKGRHYWRVVQGQLFNHLSSHLDFISVFSWQYLIAAAAAEPVLKCIREGCICSWTNAEQVPYVFQSSASDPGRRQLNARLNRSCDFLSLSFSKSDRLIWKSCAVLHTAGQSRRDCQNTWTSFYNYKHRAGLPLTDEWGLQRSYRHNVLQLIAFPVFDRLPRVITNHQGTDLNAGKGKWLCAKPALFWGILERWHALWSRRQYVHHRATSCMQVICEGRSHAFGQYTGLHTCMRTCNIKWCRPASELSLLTFFDILLTCWLVLLPPAVAAIEPPQRAANAVYSHPSDGEIIAKLFRGRPATDTNKSITCWRSEDARKDRAWLECNMWPNKFCPIQLARATHSGQSTGPQSICLMKPVDIWSVKSDSNLPCNPFFFNQIQMLQPHHQIVQCSGHFSGDGAMLGATYIAPQWCKCVGNLLYWSHVFTSKCKIPSTVCMHSYCHVIDFIVEMLDSSIHTTTVAWLHLAAGVAGLCVGCARVRPLSCQWHPDQDWSKGPCNCHCGLSFGCKFVGEMCKFVLYHLHKIAWCIQAWTCTRVVKLKP